MKTIEFTLSRASIDDALREIQAYKESLAQKCELLRNMVAEYIRGSAEIEYRVAVGQVNKVGDDDGKDVYVDVDYSNDGLAIVIADGKDAVFLEYGAGVYFNGSVGTSPHPWGEKVGALIGMYGQGHGSQETWQYDNVVTYGTPASMGMYRATMELITSGVLEAFVKDVFG